MKLASHRHSRRSARPQVQIESSGHEKESASFFQPATEPRSHGTFFAKLDEEKPSKAKAPEEEKPVKTKLPEEEKPVKAKCGCGCGGSGACVKTDKEPSMKAKALGNSSRSAKSSNDECTAAQQAAAQSALSAAGTMARRAAATIDGACGSDEPAGPPPTELINYERWFGEFSMARAQYVRQTYAAIVGAVGRPVLFRCDNQRELFAYVCPTDPGIIYLGKLFWTRGSGSGRDSHAGILLHELGHHAWGSLGDYGYGVDAAQDLAENFPDAAVQNADNYEYYAESL
jgi:peptidyl-Lys metalloendopeptidase